MNEFSKGYQPNGTDTTGQPPSGGTGVPSKINDTNVAYTTVSGVRRGMITCGLCGMKTYLATDGSHRRCPECDDL